MQKLGAARTLLWHAKGISAKTETGRREDRPMDFKDRRIWYAVAAVIIVLINHRLRDRLVWRRARTGTPAVSSTAACRRITEKVLS